MKKISIIIAMILWICTSIRLLDTKIKTDETIEAAFSCIQFDTITASVDAFGDYGITHMTDEEKENLLYNIGACIGISRPCDIQASREDNKDVMTLSKRSKNGNVVIRILTDETLNGTVNVAHQYISVGIQLYNSIDCAASYKELVRDIFDANGIDGRVNLNLRGEAEGTMNYRERSAAADKMLAVLDARVVAQSRESDIFTIYAYTAAIDEYIISAGEKVNVNIAAEYDEINNRTVIYLATPMNNLDY